jgi:hypothetical protein
MRLLIFFLCSLLASCATLSGITGGAIGSQILWNQMMPVMGFRGFSVEKPSNILWYIRRGEQSPSQVIFRRPTGSDTHTVYVQVALGGLERCPTSHEDFAELARSQGQFAPYEVEETRRDHEMVTIQNQWCIRIETDAITRGAPNSPDQELALVIRGYRCLHPSWRRTTVDFFYSERGLPEEIEESYQAQGESILGGVRMDSAPYTPVD